MKTIGIFYGSTTGNTQKIAHEIATRLGVGSDSVFDIAGGAARLADYDVLLLGTSTWGIGDLQDDWEGAINDLGSANLSGKLAGVFGTGDSSSYPDSFCDAVATLAETAEKAGAKLIGDTVPTDGYTYDDSRALRGEVFCGLLIDEDNEPDRTDDRVNRWVESIKPDIDQQ